MADQPVLLTVTVNVDPAGDRAFNEWAHTHLPRLLQVEGYRWARRYRGAFGPTGYLAMYEIADRSYLPSLVGPDTEKRPALVNSEFAAWNDLKGLSDISISVWEQIYGLPFTPTLMDRDYPLSLVTSDCRPDVEDAFNDWYSNSHVPNLLKVPGYISGMRFRRVADPILEHLGEGPRYLALYELHGLDAIPHLTDPETMNPEARAEFQNFQTLGRPLIAGEIGWSIFRPIAKHWPI